MALAPHAVDRGYFSKKATANRLLLGHHRKGEPMRMNRAAAYTERTHEGAPAARLTPEQQLRRSVMSCLLWERSFYEDGVEIAERIKSLVPTVDPQRVVEIALAARTDYKLRHAPLWVALAMLGSERHRQYVARTIFGIVQRPDEMGEIVSMLWPGGNRQKHGGKCMPRQVRLGLAKAFGKFDEYQLRKYNRPDAVKLRDVLFMTHAKPRDEAQAALWKRLIAGELAPAETWEERLSAGQDKREVFTDMLSRGKLGALALLRNLRNMIQAGVDVSAIRAGLTSMKVERVLPYRFIAAARHAAQLEPELEQAMYRCMADAEKLTGSTVLLVDVSGSMAERLSAKSDMNRLDAACGLAILLREVCPDLRVFTFSNALVEVPPRRGFALRDAVTGSQPHGGTYLGQAVAGVPAAARHVVVTDEQSHDQVGAPKAEQPYMLNVGTDKNGVGYGAWTRINGWSEASVRFMQEVERPAN